MKKPTTAPSNDKIMLTSIASTPTNVVKIRKNVVNARNILRACSGLFTSDMNYLRVKKNNIGNTEKFWNKMPAWTILPIIKKLIC